MRALVTTSLVGLLVAFAGVAGAQTPDGQTPSQETVCDSLSGAAYGLCTAYCEAMDCDSGNHYASTTACERVFNNYMRIVGTAPPCENVCPCTVIDGFADMVGAGSSIDSCVGASNITMLVGAAGTAFVDTREAVQCGFGTDSWEVMSITLEESDSCRQLLFDAASAHGLSCG